MGFSPLSLPILSPLAHAGHYSALDPEPCLRSLYGGWLRWCWWRTLKLTFYDPHFARPTSPSLSLSVHLATFAQLDTLSTTYDIINLWFRSAASECGWLNWLWPTHPVNYNKNKKHRELCTNRSRPILTPGHALFPANPWVRVGAGPAGTHHSACLRSYWSSSGTPHTNASVHRLRSSSPFWKLGY